MWVSTLLADDVIYILASGFAFLVDPQGTVKLRDMQQCTNTCKKREDY